MRLVWKLLRQHISLPQFAGFFLANLTGMAIVLLGFQAYRDVLPVFEGGDTFMKSDYLIVAKQVAAGTGFAPAECDDLSHQSWVNRVGRFVPAEYRADARMGIDGQRLLSTEIFFESVPDEFLDMPLDKWRWDTLARTVPIVLPRSYLTMYNFGFARARQLPRITDGVASLLDVTIAVGGDEYEGRVVGFSSRLNSILVPQAFMDWSNRRYAPERDSEPTRLLLDVANPTDEHIAQYLADNGMELEDGNLDAEKTAYFLRMLVMLVMAVGLTISALSFYILMLSIYLLVEKNSTKLENLLLTGYSPAQVARPYQLLTTGLNLLVLVLALGAVALARSYYMAGLTTLFPELDDGSLLPAVALGVGLCCVVSLLNVAALRRKVMLIWRHDTDK